MHYADVATAVHLSQTDTNNGSGGNTGNEIEGAGYRPREERRDTAAGDGGTDEASIMDLRQKEEERPAVRIMLQHLFFFDPASNEAPTISREFCGSMKLLLKAQAWHAYTISISFDSIKSISSSREPNNGHFSP